MNEAPMEDKYNGPPHQQQPLAVVATQPNPPASDTALSRSNWRGMQVTGYLQVVVGVISVALGIVAIVFKAFMYPIGTPIWTGICFYIVTGIIGIVSERKKEKGLVIAYKVTCIISAVAGCGVCIAHAIGIVVGGLNGCPDIHDDETYYFFDRVGCTSSYETRAVINGVISGIGGVEMIIAIIGASMSCICCAACCRGSGQPQTQVVMYTTTVPQPGMVNYAAAAPQQQYGQQPENCMYPAPPQYEQQTLDQDKFQPPPDGQAQAPPLEKLPGPDGI